jgi:ERCC4-type nuclease
MTNKYADDRILAFPSGTRGKTAQQILDDDKSLVDIGNMSIEELKAYDKIGDKKAQLIRTHFNRRSNNE